MRVTNTFFRNWVDGPFSREKGSAVFGSSIDGVLADYVVLVDNALPLEQFDEALKLMSSGNFVGKIVLKL